MTQATSCPDAIRWQQHLLGTLSQAEHMTLIGHLDTCESCQHALEGLAAEPKWLLHTAKQIGRDAPLPSPSLEGVLTGLKRFDDLAPAESLQEALEGLGFLVPPRQPGHLGRLMHYEITSVLARGGMGIVLKALDEKLGRTVAIKVLAAPLAIQGDSRKRFVREARAAAAVHHENAVTIFAVEEAQGVPFLVMEFISGVSLQERLDRQGPLELEQILRIGMQTAAGLAAAHAQGLIHRDVKPANVLLENGVERVKLTDFGLARTSDDASLSRDGIVAGTPEYMAPEQARGETVDRRSDLFSLGSVLYAMCTGRAPFRAGSSIAVLKRVCEETPTPIREINPEVPDWLVGIVDKLLSKDPAERFQSAGEVAELLGGHLAELQSPGRAGGASLPAAREREGPHASRFLWRLAAAVVFCLLVAAGLTQVNRVTHLAGTIDRIRPGEGMPMDEVNGGQVQVPIGRAAPENGVHIPSLPADNALANHGSASPTDTVQQSSIPEMTEIRRFVGHEAIVWSVAFSPDGNQILTGSGNRLRDGQWTQGADFTVRLWDVASARQLQSFPGHQHQVQSVAFTPDGRQAVGAGKIWACRRWDVATGQELPGFSGDPAKPFFHLALSSDAARLLSWGGKDKILRLWDVNTGAELWKVDGLAEEVTAAAFSPDGRHVATAGGGKYQEQRLNPGSDYGIRLWNAVSGKEELRLLGHAAFVRGLAFLPDGRRLLSSGADDVLRLWDLKTREELHVYAGHRRPVNSIALSEDGRWAVSGSADKTVRLWEIETGRELCRFIGHTGEVRSVAISPGRRYALSGGYDETVRLWQLPEQKK